jgi:hypothetical protein
VTSASEGAAAPTGSFASALDDVDVKNNEEEKDDEQKQSEMADALAAEAEQEAQLQLHREEAEAGDLLLRTVTRGDQPVIFAFRDHFSLLVPSSRVRYREKRSGSRVTPSGDSQFVLEETYDPKSGHHEVSIRQIHDTSEGVRFLRILYAIGTCTTDAGMHWVRVVLIRLCRVMPIVRSWISVMLASPRLDRWRFLFLFGQSRYSGPDSSSFSASRFSCSLSST